MWPELAQEESRLPNLVTDRSENESFNEDLILELCMNINKFDIISFSVL